VLEAWLTLIVLYGVVEVGFRACLAGLRLCQTHSGAAAPPICGSIVELDSHFGAEEMCLAEITTPASKSESLNRLPSFALNVLAFFPVRCVGVLCVRGCAAHGVFPLNRDSHDFFSFECQTNKSCF
jgi:hypothetical protein